jgi:hypothetical protein
MRDVALLLCGVGHDLGRALASTGLEGQLGERRIFYDRPSHEVSRRDAVRTAYLLLGDVLCATCPRRPERGVTHPLGDYVI